MGFKFEWNRKRKIITIVSLVLFFSLFCFIYFRYYFVYSEGTRVGILYKFSKKGVVFKTHEGEMVLPGIRFKSNTAPVSSNMFYFSVRDEKIAKTLMQNQGAEIEVHYVYYFRPLPWRGDRYENEKGQYIVDYIIKIKNQNPNGYGL